MPKEAAMTRTSLLARCSAAAATAILFAGLAAAPATARPDPGEPAPQQSQSSDGTANAAERRQQLSVPSIGGGDGSANAVERREHLSVPSSSDGDVVATPDDEFPWAIASLAAAGLAAVATGGVIAQRRRTALLPA
jgi:hypothetical protein